MLFNSIPYLIFLPSVFLIYWIIFGKSLKLQNLFLLLASYLFYAWWDYRFLLLIFLSTAIDYYCGIFISESNNIKKRKWWLGLSLMTNLGLLGFFKYFNFFIDSWSAAWADLGVDLNVSSLNIILPVGISFYSFQTLSYTIDVYKKRMEPSQKFLDFALYVSFFPQLVAGPIERAQKLLPQILHKRKFNIEQAKSGLHLIIWGLFKKMVIADTCAIYVNSIFENYQNLDSFNLILGAVFFSFQIYCDFSGYSDIAIGTARLFGINLMQNFNYPYFSRNIGEFWRRWHISLSTWFRDYLYIPLGGSKGTMDQTIRNVFIIFVVSGLWHGANWTFIIWGGLHALLFIPVLLMKRNRLYLDSPAYNKFFPSIQEILQMVLTFLLVTFFWIFFRAETLSSAFGYISRLIDLSNYTKLSIEKSAIQLVLLLLFFVFLEWFNRQSEHPINGKFQILKISFIIILILIFGNYSDKQEFIYFQF